MDKKNKYNTKTELTKQNDEVRILIIYTKKKWSQEAG